MDTESSINATLAREGWTSTDHSYAEWSRGNLLIRTVDGPLPFELLQDTLLGPDRIADYATLEEALLAASDNIEAVVGPIEPTSAAGMP